MRNRALHAIADAAGLCAAAAICAFLVLAIVASTAWADEADDAQRAVDDAQATLDDAEQRMKDLAAQHDELEAELEALQKRIDETAAQAKVSQEAVIEGRAVLGKAAAYEYRDGGSARSLLTLLLESSDFNELMRNLSYLGAIVDYQADEIAAQQQRTEEFESLLDELNDQKTQHDAKLKELEEKKAEAEQVVSDANAKLKNAKGDQAARLAELQKKAEELAASGDEGKPVVVDDADTVDRQDVVPPDAEVKPDPNPDPPAGGGSGSGDDGSNAGDDSGSQSGGSGNDAGSGGSNAGNEGSAGWTKGVASAYGGSTDPYTPNPGVTATGAVCNDWSMGVAVPMAWPRYWQYYGRTVEISYGGMTVLATVNDCGYMGGGSRSLDLQPGVWKAFGFKSCNDWGLRTVSYRFL